MRPVRTVASLAIVALAALASACGGSSGARGSYEIEPTPGRPVLLVTIDTLRWDALGSYGAETPTPALDALAARGLRVEHAVAHAVVTLPSHSTILTGLDPTGHGVHSNEGHRLGDGLDTWAERLRAAGYETGAFVGAFVVDAQFGLGQGFDVYDDEFEETAAGSTTPASPAANVERRAETVVASALGWLEGRTDPWFAWVHVYDPHDPYEAPEPFGSRYAGDGYTGEVAYVDDALAPLLEEARARDAIVVVTADHGEGLGEHGEETHGLFAYASTLRVPLIVAGIDGAPEGAVVPDRVRHIDILPTVLEALGLPFDDLPGLSLGRAETPSERRADEAYFEALTPYLDWGWQPLRGLYGGGVKYLDLPEHESGWPPLHGIYAGDYKFIDLPIPELYDVAEDPQESVNLAGRRPLEVRQLRERLRAYMAEAAAPDATTVAEDEETLRRLRALGYLSGGGGSAPGEVAIEDFGPEDDPKTLIRIEEQIQQAIRAMRREGREREAIATLEQVLQERPGLVRAHSLLATVRARIEGVAGEIAALERAVNGGVEAPYVFERLGRAYAQTGRLAEAETIARRGLDTAADNVELLELLATLQASRGRVGEAEATFARALEIAPDNGVLRASHGTLLLSTGRVPAAVSEFERALELDPTAAEAHNGLGIVASQQGDLQTAVEHWSQAAELPGVQPFVLYNLGLALERMGRTPEAIQALTRYLELNPGDGDAREVLARLQAR